MMPQSKRKLLIMSLYLALAAAGASADSAAGGGRVYVADRKNRRIAVTTLTYAAERTCSAMETKK